MFFLKSSADPGSHCTPIQGHRRRLNDCQIPAGIGNIRLFASAWRNTVLDGNEPLLNCVFGMADTLREPLLVAFQDCSSVRIKPFITDFVGHRAIP